MGTRQDRHQTFNQKGALVAETVVNVDVTYDENLAAITGYLVDRRARLSEIRTQAQGIVGTATFSNTTRDSALRALASAVDDLAQFDIRLSRRVLELYDAVD